MWFAENKSWSQFRRSLGSFSAIVCKDASTVWAEDQYGKTIAQGEAGVDDASVIQSAVNLGGIIFIKAGDYILNEKINLVSNLRLIGEGIGKTNFKKTGDDVAFRGKDVENVVLQDFYFDCNGYGGTGYEYDPSGGTFYASAIGIQASGDRPVYNIHLKRIKTYNGIGAHIRIGCDTNDLENTYRNVVIEQVECHLNPYGEGASNPMLLVETGNGVVLRDCYVHEVSNKVDGCIALDGKNIWAYNCIAEEGYEGIRIEPGSRDAKNINIIGGKFSYNKQGIFLHPGAKEVTIRGVLCKRNIWHGIVFYGTGTQQKIDIFDCWLIENGYSESATATLSVNGDSVYEVRIERCKFINNNFATGESRAITIFKGDKITIKDNLIIDDRDTSYLRWGIEFRSGTITNVVCKNNRIYGAYEKAIARTYGATVSGIFRRNIADAPIDLKSENSGTATFSGDGVATVFEIGAHGLVTTDPSKIVVKVSPVSSDAIAASPCVGYVDPVDNTKIKVKFSSAPASGANNVKIVWYAEVIS